MSSISKRQHCDRVPYWSPPASNGEGRGAIHSIINSSGVVVIISASACSLSLYVYTMLFILFLFLFPTLLALIHRSFRSVLVRFEAPLSPSSSSTFSPSLSQLSSGWSSFFLDLDVSVLLVRARAVFVCVSIARCRATAAASLTTAVVWTPVVACSPHLAQPAANVSPLLSSAEAHTATTRTKRGAWRRQQQQ